MMNLYPFHSGIPARPDLPTSQTHGPGQQLTQPEPNQTNFHHAGFMGAGVRQEQQPGGQHNQSEQDQQYMINYPESHDSGANNDNFQTYVNPCYPPGVAPHTHQSQDPHPDYLQTSDPIKPHHTAVNRQVASVLALELPPSIIQANPNVQVQVPPTRPENNPPRPSQKRNNARRRQELTHAAPTTAPTNSTITPTSTQTQAPTTTRAIINLFLLNSLRGEQDTDLLHLIRISYPQYIFHLKKI